MDSYTKDLARMAKLNQLLEEQGEAPDPKAVYEYRVLLQKLVPQFLGLMERLCEAGMLTIYLESEALQEARDWAKEVSPLTRKLGTVSFDVVQAFDNGSIWLRAGKVNGASSAEKPQHYKQN